MFLKIYLRLGIAFLGFSGTALCSDDERVNHGLGGAPLPFNPGALTDSVDPSNDMWSSMNVAVDRRLDFSWQYFTNDSKRGFDDFLNKADNSSLIDQLLWILANENSFVPRSSTQSTSSITQINLRKASVERNIYRAGLLIDKLTERITSTTTVLPFVQADIVKLNTALQQKSFNAKKEQFETLIKTAAGWSQKNAPKVLTDPAREATTIAALTNATTSRLNNGVILGLGVFGGKFQGFGGTAAMTGSISLKSFAIDYPNLYGIDYTLEAFNNHLGLKELSDLISHFRGIRDYFERHPEDFGSELSKNKFQMLVTRLTQMVTQANQSHNNLVNSFEALKLEINALKQVSLFKPYSASLETLERAVNDLLEKKIVFSPSVRDVSQIYLGGVDFDVPQPVVSSNFSSPQASEVQKEVDESLLERDQEFSQLAQNVSQISLGGVDLELPRPVPSSTVLSPHASEVQEEVEDSRLEVRQESSQLAQNVSQISQGRADVDVSQPVPSSPLASPQASELQERSAASGLGTPQKVSTLNEAEGASLNAQKGASVDRPESSIEESSITLSQSSTNSSPVGSTVSKNDSPAIVSYALLLAQQTNWTPDQPDTFIRTAVADSAKRVERSLNNEFDHADDQNNTTTLSNASAQQVSSSENSTTQDRSRISLQAGDTPARRATSSGNLSDSATEEYETDSEEQEIGRHPIETRDTRASVHTTEPVPATTNSISQNDHLDDSGSSEIDPSASDDEESHLGGEHSLAPIHKRNSLPVETTTTAAVLSASDDDSDDEESDDYETELSGLEDKGRALGPVDSRSPILMGNPALTATTTTASTVDIASASLSTAHRCETSAQARSVGSLDTLKKPSELLNRDSNKAQSAHVSLSGSLPVSSGLLPKKLFSDQPSDLNESTRKSHALDSITASPEKVKSKKKAPAQVGASVPKKTTKSGLGIMRPVLGIAAVGSVLYLYNKYYGDHTGALSTIA